MLITRQVEFSASHTCSSPALDRAANEALYGAEANPQGHGHNFVLEVTLEQEVVEPMDHRHLNREVAPFDHVVPTPENLALEIWRRLEPRFAGTPARLKQIRLFETDDLYVEYEGR
jgi:6-pyruvoyltetrahydropterin/6-carboxytetrahydropterin synthase